MSTLINLPPNTSAKNTMVKAFDAYNNQTIELDTSTLSSMQGFFQSKGFDTVASESISVVIMKQAKSDNLNPMKVLDTLKGFDAVELSALVAEIINFNRFKTSFLGYARAVNTPEEISRNILP